MVRSLQAAILLSAIHVKKQECFFCFNSTPHRYLLITKFSNFTNDNLVSYRQPFDQLPFSLRSFLHLFYDYLFIHFLLIILLSLQRDAFNEFKNFGNSLIVI